MNAVFSADAIMQISLVVWACHIFVDKVMFVLLKFTTVQKSKRLTCLSVIWFGMVVRWDIYIGGRLGDPRGSGGGGVQGVKTDV